MGGLPHSYQLCRTTQVQGIPWSGQGKEMGRETCVSGTSPSLSASPAHPSLGSMNSEMSGMEVLDEVVDFLDRGIPKEEVMGQ